jgi:NAD(P)-dependent dehydrogenase (short-subunit alcohol dehydrogenase family)
MPSIMAGQSRRLPAAWLVSIGEAAHWARHRTWRIVMSDKQLTGTTALVTGASRGFGRGIATALSEAGAQVVGVARDRGALEELRAQLGGSFTAVAADSVDPMVAGELIDRYRPGVLVLNAGAAPLPRPVHRHTWETFSRNWDVDVRHTFNWVREALLAPLAPGSTVITLSSGAAVFGSPLSGGYSGAKAAIRWLTAYAGEESARDELGIRFVSLLPQLTPATALGAVFAAAYAAREGAGATGRTGGQGAALTPDQVGQAVTGLATGPAPDRDAYLVTTAGLRPLP